MSPTPDPPTAPTDAPSTPDQSELARERNAVRRLEAALAAVHGADTPAYWRAMSEQLHAYLAGPRFTGDQDRSAGEERAYNWLTRISAAYRALAASSS